MKIAFFSSQPYDRQFFEKANESDEHQLIFYDVVLNQESAHLAKGCHAVCAFVNDELDEKTLWVLRELGIQAIALRCAGYNNVDMGVANLLEIPVVRVPAYSPHAVAEHTMALLLCLNRKIHRAFNRVRESNFSLDGLLGYDLHGLTVGVVGTGKIGECVCQILHGFGCNLLAHDPNKNPTCLKMGVQYVDAESLFSQSDIITLHCPLMPETHHLVNQKTIELMKSNVTIINTSRGGLIDTDAMIKALKRKQIGALGIDVYEEEADLFFNDLSGQIIQDDSFARLTTFPNVIVTGHQGFFTKDALEQISSITLDNLSRIEKNQPCSNKIEC